MLAMSEIFPFLILIEIVAFGMMMTWKLILHGREIARQNIVSYLTGFAIVFLFLLIVSYVMTAKPSKARDHRSFACTPTESADV